MVLFGVRIELFLLGGSLSWLPLGCCGWLRFIAMDGWFLVAIVGVYLIAGCVGGCGCERLSVFSNGAGVAGKGDACPVTNIPSSL
jgi:hypothetical protein